MLSGAAVATIRDVRKTDGPWEIFAAFCIGGMVISAPPALVNWVPPRLSEWLLLVVVGSLSLVAQLLMTYAFRYVRAAVGGVIVQLTPVASLALGWIVLDERIAGIALVGAALALLGVSLGTYLARKPA
jgi:drug/metabolite transporter (DMT)-like permease